MNLAESPLPIQLQLVTIVEKIHVKVILNPTEMVMMGIRLRGQQEIFQNGSQRSLLFQMRYI